MTGEKACLVIGVTGHRKLADESRLAAAVDVVLDEIVRRAAGERAGGQDGIRDETPQLRLLVLSPLAEGADRFIAKRVLAREASALEAVLPMDEPDYEADFAADASKSEFRSLLDGARTIHRLPGSSSREEAYAAAGRYVVDHCDILIAVWDGKAGEGPGGTAEIVRYARQQHRALAWIRPDESGPVLIDGNFGSRI
jgi:hypothetical protein